MINTGLGFSREYEELRQALAALRGGYSELAAEYDDLKSTVAPNLEAEYMMKIGRKEFQAFSLQIDIQRVKREIALCQAAANHGGKMDSAELQAIIEREFAEYLEALREQQRKVQDAEARFAAVKLDPEETRKLRQLYLSLVKKLHPDLHPNLPPAAHELWLRIVAANERADWLELILLGEMCDEILAGADYQPPVPDTVSALKDELAKLTAKTGELRAHIARLEGMPPLSYRGLLQDPGQVARRRDELDSAILAMEKHLAELQNILRQLRNSQA